MAYMTARVTYSVELTKPQMRLIGLALQGLLTRPEDIQEATELGVKLLKSQLQAFDVQRDSIANALNCAEKEPT